MNFDKFNEIQNTRPNLREMADATAIGEYRNSGCGDAYRVFLKVDGRGVIEDASFTTTGCGFGLAALALCCEAAKGKTVDEAAQLTTDDIERGVEGFPERRKNYPASALEAFHVALANHRAGGRAASAGTRTTREELLRLAAEGLPLSVDGSHLDLSGIDLRGARFEGGNFTGASFAGAYLMAANFHKCPLRGADFSRADLCGATLRRADLYHANLSGAELCHADLRNALLTEADLSGAILAGARLEGARLNGARLEGIRLAGACFDLLTRFDPGATPPYELMFRRDGPGRPFIEGNA